MISGCAGWLELSALSNLLASTCVPCFRPRSFGKLSDVLGNECKFETSLLSDNSSGYLHMVYMNDERSAFSQYLQHVIAVVLTAFQGGRQSQLPQSCDKPQVACC